MRYGSDAVRPAVEREIGSTVGRRTHGQSETFGDRGHFGPRLAATALLTVALSTLLFTPAVPAELPLFEQEPYDKITLNQANNNSVLIVEPIDLPGRRVPAKPNPSDKLRIRLVDRPEKTYEVRWHSIAKVELFEQLVLNKADELVRAGKYDEAYDYFQFLLETDPKLPGLNSSINDYLYEQAKTFHRNRQYDAALAMLREIYARNPDYTGLEKALGVTTEKLVEQYVAAENYRAARRLIDNLADWFPGHAVVSEWQSRFKDQAAALLAEARSALAAGELRKADQAGRRMVLVWPKLPGAKELVEAIYRKYPRVVVGVTEKAVGSGQRVLGSGQRAVGSGQRAVGSGQKTGLLHVKSRTAHTPSPSHPVTASPSHPVTASPSHPVASFSFSNWACRRSERLTDLTLMEYIGSGSAGGRYRCPVGVMEIEELGRRLAFSLHPDFHLSAGGPSLTGYDVARRLLSLADSSCPGYQSEWAELLDSVAVRDVYRVEADLHRTHVRPEALLRTSLVADGTAAGPYSVASTSDDETVYVSQNAVKGPKEIVERYLPRAAQAIPALKRGRIDVLDRVNPWSLDEIRALPAVAVEPYGLPLVHCLVPNLRKPLMARRAFRRALVYGIHRQMILNHLLGGRELPGCQIISGPFLPGLSYDDPLNYAYDPGIEPRGYEPRLAIALAEVALKEVTEDEKKGDKKQGSKKGGKKSAAKEPLVLAYPPSEIAEAACKAIRRHLELVGITITLKELPPGGYSRIPENVDLLYAELAMWEPVVDARRLLGPSGMSGGCSPYMSLALRQLQDASRWPEVRARLRQIHRLAHDEVAVVPLWQLTDHFAYRRSLQGAGTRPVSLYQNVQQWQPVFQYPAEEK